MKTKMKTLLALTVATVAAATTLNLSASPRTDQFLDEHKTSGLAPGDQIDRGAFGNARGRALVDEGNVYCPSSGDKMDRETMTSPRQREAHNMATPSAATYETYDEDAYLIYESEPVAEPATEFDYQYEPSTTVEPDDMEELDDIDYTPDSELNQDLNEDPTLNEYPDAK